MELETNMSYEISQTEKGGDAMFLLHWSVDAMFLLRWMF